MWTIKELRRAVWKNALRPVALQALRHTGTLDVTPRSLRKLRQRGVRVEMIVDGGAAFGEFAADVKKIFPHAQVLCVEPREEERARLDALAARLPGIHVEQVLLGDHEGEADFSVHAEQSSLLPNASGSTFGDQRRLPMTTLDALIERRGLPWPDLIKLDLQGAELMCLKGASRCLAHAQLVLAEVSILPVYKGAPLLADVVGFLAARGFRTYDIPSLWHRPLDGALAYGDFLFIRDDSPLVRDGRWSRSAPWEKAR